MYSISLSDPTKDTKISIPDYELDNTSTSLKLFGNNYESYGVYFWENLLHLVENFCNNKSPDNPIQGQLWYNSDTKELSVYDNGWNNVIKTINFDTSQYINTSKDDYANTLIINKYPVLDNDVATKQYVDNYHGGIKTYENSLYNYVLYPNKFIIIYGTSSGDVKLPFEMADDSYGCVATGEFSSSSYSITNKTNNSFTVNSNQWMVVGYIK